MASKRSSTSSALNAPCRKFLNAFFLRPRISHILLFGHPILCASVCCSDPTEFGNRYWKLDTTPIRIGAISPLLFRELCCTVELTAGRNHWYSSALIGKGKSSGVRGTKPAGYEAIDQKTQENNSDKHFSGLQSFSS
jgi:hypothetical protein